MSAFGYRYRCSICGELVDPPAIAAHLRDERDRDTWPGVLEWERVNDTADDPDGFDDTAVPFTIRVPLADTTKRHDWPDRLKGPG